MIVCSCNVFSDADVRDCLRCIAAPRNAREVYDCLGCAPKCGVCVETIRNIMEVERRLAAEAKYLAVAAPSPVPKSSETRAFSGGDCL